MTARECTDPPPVHIYNMDKTWPWRKRKTGDLIKYTCPPRKFIMEPLPKGAEKLASKFFIEYGHDVHPLRGNKNQPPVFSILRCLQISLLSVPGVMITPKGIMTAWCGSRTSSRSV